MKRFVTLFLSICMLFTTLPVFASEWNNPSDWKQIEMPTFGEKSYITQVVYEYNPEKRDRVWELFPGDGTKGLDENKETLVKDSIIKILNKCDYTHQEGHTELPEEDPVMIVMLDLDHGQNNVSQMFLLFWEDYLVVKSDFTIDGIMYCNYSNYNPFNELKALLDPYTGGRDAYYDQKEKEREEDEKNAIYVTDFKKLYHGTFKTTPYNITEWGICEYTIDKPYTAIYLYYDGSYDLIYTKEKENKLNFYWASVIVDNVFYEGKGFDEPITATITIDENYKVTAIKLELSSNRTIDVDMSTYQEFGSLKDITQFEFALTPTKEEAKPKEPKPKEPKPEEPKQEQTTKPEKEETKEEVPPKKEETTPEKEEVKPLEKEEDKKPVQKEEEKPVEKEENEQKPKDEEKEEPYTQVFSDVPVEHWAFSDIAKLHSQGIVKGVGDGKFAPNNAITYEHFGFLLDRQFNYKWEKAQTVPALRQDVVAALVKALGLENTTVKNENILKETFTDYEDITKENERLVKIAIEHGLVIGYGGELHANSNLTRAEAVTFLSRGIDLIKK